MLKIAVFYEKDVKITRKMNKKRNQKTKQKNGINREYSRKTEQTVLSRNNRLKKFLKTEVLVTSEIRAQRVRQQSRKLQRKRALRQTILKSSLFQWR